MTSSTPLSPRGSLDVWDKVGGTCSAVAGIAPPALTGFGYHWVSLYNPPIYEHLEPFLLIPIIVALFSSWSVMTSPVWSMRIIFVASLLLAIVVLLVYLKFPEQYTVSSISIHALNWILSYCVLAMAIALLFGFLLALKRV